MRRVVLPEMLDELPADSPDAMRSRRDLVRINAWMRNAAIAAGEIKALSLAGPLRIADLGGGDGAHALKLVRSLRNSTGEVVVVDRQNILLNRARFEAVGWRVRIHQGDVFDWAVDAEVFDIVLANLFLHHFTGNRLHSLFSLLSLRCKTLIAVEPHRKPIALALARLLWLIGCNHVTRHDAVLSVRAGFSEGELSALWPDQSGWTLREYAAGFSSYVFVATKK